MQTAIVGGDVSALKAREAFLAYRNLVKEGRATEDDEILMRSYKALSQGKRVLDLRETLKIGGLNDRYEPRLAISRADQPHIVFEHFSSVDRWCYVPDRRVRKPPFADGRAVSVPTGVYPAIDGHGRLPDIGKEQWRFRIRAAVPPIPAQFRPAGGLAPFHILWEAEWQPIAPKDPILLKRIGGYLYAVLAQWDLTELERAVLGARLS